MFTTVPATITALLAALEASEDLDGVTIFDGPPTKTLDRDDAIIVGFTGQAGEPSITSDRTESDLGGRRDRETYTVWSMLSTVSGDTDLSPLRTRAIELLAVVGGILRADPTLGGAVTRARLAETTLEQAQTQAGAEVNIALGVRVDAFVR